MHLRRKYLGVASLGIGVAVLLTLATTLFHSHQRRIKDQLFTAQTLAQSLASLAQQKSQSFAEELVQVVASEKNRGMESPIGPRFMASNFLATGLFSEADGKWSLHSKSARPGATDKWPQGFIDSLSAQLPMAQVQGQKLIWTRLLDVQNQPLFALLVAVQAPGQSQQQIALGLLPVAVFSEWLSPVRGLQAEAIVIDARGFALSFTEQRYAGATMEAHPFVQAVLQQRELAGQGHYKNLGGKKMLGSFARVEANNLYTLLLLPQPQWGFTLIVVLSLAVAFIIVGLLLVLGLGKLVMDPFQQAFAYLHDSLVDLSNGKPIAYPSGDLDLLAHLREPVRRIQALATGEKLKELNPNSAAKNVDVYKPFGSGLAQALKGPLASVLGHAQLARTKSESEEVKQHFVVIEREARRARDIIENLVGVIGGEGNKQEATNVDLRDVILAALAEVRTDLYANNIQVIKDLNVSMQIKAPAAQLQSAIEELFRNAIEAMEKSEVKELKVSLRDEESMAILTIEDSGIGIEAKNLNKVFEPFFTTRETQAHVGLGLAMVKGAVTGCGGKIQVNSEPGLGSRFILHFPMVGAVRKLNEEKFTMKVVPAELDSGPTLGGLNPLTGTEVDQLPIAPQVDEITQINSEAVSEETPSAINFNTGEAEAVLSPVLPDEMILNLGEELTPTVEKAMPDVAVRNPKVRGQS